MVEVWGERGETYVGCRVSELLKSVNLSAYQSEGSDSTFITTSERLNKRGPFIASRI
jgi:hypothetical protein